MTISPLSAAGPQPTRPDDAAKVADSARAFEAILVRQVLGDTFKAAPATKGHPAPGSDIYQGFITDAMAEHISGSLGLGAMLQSQLAPPSPRPAPAP